MREIKFRGESAIGTVHGFYVEHKGKPYIINDTVTMISVDKESVSQLCGYDFEGNEIYEGDDSPTDVDKVAKKFADDFINYLKGGKSRNIIEKVLKQYMPDEAISYMKWSLNNGKKVHVYGRQGSGKSTIRDMFAKYQYPVTAPEDVDPYEEPF